MGQRRILMSQEELQRYHVLSKAIEGRMSALDAAGILYLSRRQVFRLKAKVMVYGPEGIIHGNRGRGPVLCNIDSYINRTHTIPPLFVQDQAGYASKPFLPRNEGSVTQSTYHGLRRQGTDCNKGSVGPGSTKLSCLYPFLFYTTSVSRRK